jgi:hypothetical protein
MDREEFLAELNRLSPKEIEERVSTWDPEQLRLAQEHLAKKMPVNRPQTDRSESGSSKLLTERTIAAALISLGLILAALMLRGGYEIAASSVGAYVVNRFTGTTWQCLNTCVRLETSSSPEKKK